MSASPPHSGKRLADLDVLRGIAILLVVVLVLVGVIAYIFTRGRRDEASEWTEMPEEPAP